MEARVQQLIHKFFGYQDFMPGQEQIIKSILTSHDTIGVLPTGGGKSLCYQLPALVLPGLTLVISPLIALMKDQVDALKEQGVAASYINSSLRSSEINARLSEACKGSYKLLYIAPERLESQVFTELLNELPLSLVAIDEAHCVSQWGHDFRPSYLAIASWVATLPQRPVLAAFTATATAQVREDINNLLGLKQATVFINSFDRPNLYFSVVKGAERIRLIRQYLQQHPKDSGIIYAATRKEVESIFTELQTQNYQVAKYHAGLTSEERNGYQEAFIYDQTQVIIATNAFGLGIDKSNVRFVIHHNMPRHLEAYYQEAGRAGRDGEAADCILFYQPADIQIQKYLIEQSSLSPERKLAEYQKLQSMIDYCHTTHCLRQYILEYFGENCISGLCSQCANCCEHESRDITVEAQKIFSCIFRMKQQYGSTLVASVLKGSQQKRVLDLGFDRLSTYGIMSELKTADIVELINLLAAEDYLTISAGQYPVVQLSPRATPILKGQEKVVLRLPRVPISASPDNSLFQELRALRQQIAIQQKVPPYIIFSDHSLREMSTHLPLERESMLEISGVGQVKFERYGQKFLDVIDRHVKDPSNREDSIPKKNELQTVDISSNNPKKRPTTEEKKIPTHLLSWQKYQEGESLKEIALERELHISTIQSHLIKAAQEGHSVNWDEFITPRQEKQILEAAQVMGSGKLSLIKEALPNEITYFAIKIALFKAQG